MANETWLASSRETLTTGGLQMTPSVATLADGGYVVSWISIPDWDTPYSAHARIFNADGSPRTAEFVLSEAPFNDSFNGPELRVHALSDGGFVASWDEQDTPEFASPTHYVTRLFDAQGNARTGELAVNDFANPRHGQAFTVALAGGGFVVGWLDHNPDHNPQPGVQIYDAQGRRIGGNIVGFQGDLSPSGGSADTVGVSGAPLANGGFELVWTRWIVGPSEFHVDTYAQSFDASGHATSGIINLIFWPPGTSDQLHLLNPHVEVQPDTGRIVLETNKDENDAIYAIGYNPNGTAAFGPYYLSPGRAMFDQSLAMLPDGGYVLSWMRQGDGAQESALYAQRFTDQGAPLGETFQVGISRGFDWFNVRHHIEPTWDGGAIVAWEDDMLDAADIFVRHYTPVGATLAGATIVGTAGNDNLHGTVGNDTISAGSGLDTVSYASSRLAYAIDRDGDTVHVRGPDGSDVLAGVERIQFAGGLGVALDVGGNAGLAYRLYQAAFDRAPDLGGLGYQMHALDGGLSPHQLSANFLASHEGQSHYGAADNAQFVTALYANVLHRAPDQGGFEFHMQRLESGVARADVLIGFSESPENQAAVIGVIDNGMAYIA